MSAEPKAVRLDEAQCLSFAENGFLAIDRLLDDEDLTPLEDEYAALLDDLAKALVRAGKIADAHADLPFAERYTEILVDHPDLHRHFNISLPLINGAVDPETYHAHAGPAVFALLRHPKILDVVECLIGPEITCSPVQQMRMKPPERRVGGGLKGHSNVGQTTWHQDIVALLPEADDTEQLTVWLAITEATVENGCLVSVPGSHREGPKAHCANAALASEPHVPERLMARREAVPLPVKRGGVVLFNKMNIHRALPNKSTGLRWSMDLRYHPTGQASGRPAFPGFVARSRANPDQELRDPVAWARSWDEARARIVTGAYHGRIFEDRRWNDEAVC
jgi:phytanoyl-CoA hydroxylase